MTMKIAHLSDIHFFKLRLSPFQFFSKVFLGNFNHLFNRKKAFSETLPYAVASRLKELGVTHILITGDYTCTNSKAELSKARNYIKFLKDQGFTLFTFPGNHDAYTKKAAESKLFYHTLKDLIDFHGSGPYNLIEDRVAAYPLTPNWYLVSLDCAVSVSPAKATGLFDEASEKNLKDLLKTLPKECSILLACHFPYIPHNYPRHHLIRGNALETLILDDKRIKALVHGHRHETIIDENKTHLLIESGSVALNAKSTFSILELDENTLKVTPYIRKNLTWVEASV